jgi:hypothetical protein
VHAGGQLTVTGTGFRPNVAVEVEQCGNDPADITFCDEVRGSSESPPTLPLVVQTDASGRFTAELTISDHPAFEGRDHCGPGPQGCAVGVAEVGDPAGTFVSADITVLPGLSIVNVFGPVHVNQSVFVKAGFTTPVPVYFVVLCAQTSATDEVCTDPDADTFVPRTHLQGFFSAPLVPTTRVVDGHDCGSPATLSCDLSLRAESAPDVELASTPIVFSPYQPDGQIKRQSDGFLLGDNVYSAFDTFGQRRSHAVNPGGTWTFAVRVENDGAVTDDIRVSVGSTFGSIPIRYSYGYFDIGAAVLGGGGFVFTGLAPGEARIFAVRFAAPADAPLGSTTTTRLTFSSADDADAIDLTAKVFPPPP